MSAEKSRVKLFGKRKKIVLICLVIHHLHIHEIHENRIQMYVYCRVATVREKDLENEKISRSGKSQGITFSVREFKKNEKSQGKIREFQNFP